jgi:hypothetical protein
MRILRNFVYKRDIIIYVCAVPPLSKGGATLATFVSALACVVLIIRAKCNAIRLIIQQVIIR